MPSLVIEIPGNDEPKVVRCLGELLTLGRHDSNDVHLPTEGVSRKHARIVSDGENFYLVDLASGNGTFLNGIQVKSNEKNLLQVGDLIVIDDFNINFQEGDDPYNFSDIEEVTESDILEVKLLKKVLTALDKETVPSIEVLNGSAEGKKIFFSDDISEIVIGRDPETDFPINEHVMSRRHARIAKRWGGISIRDLDSKNGSFVNNRRVVEEFLHDGDRIALGTIVFIFRNPQEINLANIEEIRPKNRPARIEPQDIPEPEASEPEESAAEEEELPEESYNEEELSAVEQWDNLEEEDEVNYPNPQEKRKSLKSLTAIEIGMIGLGALVVIFALITIVNLLMS